MKCPKCHAPDSSVLSTRTADTGIISRRRACGDCGHRFTTRELPPGAFSYAKSDIAKWEQRQTGEWKTLVAGRQKIAKQMCELRAKGVTCNDIAIKFGQSVHMTYYYTAPKMMEKFGFSKTGKRPTSKLANPWSGLM